MDFIGHSLSHVIALRFLLYPKSSQLKYVNQYLEKETITDKK